MKLLAFGLALVFCATALAGCGAPSVDQEIDASGLTRAQKAFGWDITVSLPNGTVVHRHVTADWGKAATDGSLLADRYKYALGLDPHKLDTDEDGLTDCQEVMDTNLTHCSDPNYRGPTDGGYHTLANNAFTIGDRLIDGQKVRGWETNIQLANGTELRRHVTADPTRYATDGALQDYYKFRYGLDPHSKDSDRDGCPDALDVFPEVANATLAPGFQSFTWHGAQLAHIQLQAILGGPPFLFPDTPFAVQPGQTVDLSSLPQSAHPIGCSFSPIRPLLNIDILATWIDAPGGARNVDLASNGPTGHANPAAYYNPRTDQVSGSSSGANATAAPIVLAGADAALTLRPEPLDAAGSTLKGRNQNP